MIENFGDIIAVPFFAGLVLYFHRIPHKTTEQTILYLFSIGGFLADFIFTFIFLKQLYSFSAGHGAKMIAATILYYAFAAAFLFRHP